MPVIKITGQYDVSGNVMENTFHYYNATRIPVSSDLLGLATAFEATVVPKIAGIQTDVVSWLKVVAYAPNLGFSLEVSSDVDGTVAVGGDLTVASNLALIIKRSLGDSIQNVSGAAYTGNRPLRESRFYLGGVPESMMRADGFDLPAALADEWNDFKNALLVNVTPLTVGAFTWYHNGYGDVLEPLPPSPSFPDGKPERPALVAPVIAISGTGFTKLKTRKLGA